MPPGSTDKNALDCRLIVIAVGYAVEGASRNQDRLPSERRPHAKEDFGDFPVSRSSGLVELMTRRATNCAWGQAERPKGTLAATSPAVHLSCTVRDLLCLRKRLVAGL
jgi:hypothetical protein